MVLVIVNVSLVANNVVGIRSVRTFEVIVVVLEFLNIPVDDVDPNSFSALLVVVFEYHNV